MSTKTVPVKPAEVESPESPAAAPVVHAGPPVHKVGVPGDGMIELCPPEHRPPGRIADQHTAAAGVWARLAPDAEWVKTAIPTLGKAAQRLMKARSPHHAMELLTAV